MLPNVDWEKQVLAGVDEHGSAPYYFKLLMKRTKKDIKNMKGTPTSNNTTQRPRLESYESANSMNIPAN